MKDKKGKIKIVLCICIAVFMFLILYYIFKDSYEDIIYNLSKTSPLIFMLMVVLGNSYYFIDAFVYYRIIIKQNHHLSYLRCIAIAYMSIFFNVTSFGAGIKPGQILYMHRCGIDTGTGCSIAMMPYIFHKTVIVVYSLIMLLFNNRFVVSNFSNTFGYIYAGAGLSAGIIVFMILICSSEWFHRLICRLLDVTLGKMRFKAANENIKKHIGLLREATIKIINKPLAWISLTVINTIKVSCWYVIPSLAIYALGGNLGNISIAQALTVTSLMQLLMGVLPTSGGVGSLEVVFSVLFAAVFGKVTAGSCMILYRLSTYYIPFIFSLIMMLFIGRDLKKMKTPVPINYDEIKSVHNIADNGGHNGAPPDNIQ